VSIHAGRAECSASSEARAGGQEQGFGDTTKNGNRLDVSAQPLTLPAPFRCGHASTFSVLNLVAGPHEEYFPAVDHGKSCPTTVGGCARDPSFPFVVCPVHASVDEAVQRGMHSVPAAQSERFEFPVRFICLQALQHAGQFSAIVHRYADA